MLLKKLPFILSILFCFFVSLSFAGTTAYQYDDLNRLIRAQYPDGTVVQYTYDAAGNRISKVIAVSAKTLPAPVSGVVHEIAPAQVSATCSQPLGVGSAANGTGYLDLTVMLPGFDEAMDLYLGIYAPDLDPNHIYMVKPNGDLAQFTGFTPGNLWKTGVTSVFRTQPLSKYYSGGQNSSGIPVPAGRYSFYLLVVPAGTTGIPSNYYFWYTAAEVNP